MVIIIVVVFVSVNAIGTSCKGGLSRVTTEKTLIEAVNVASVVTIAPSTVEMI